MLLLDKRHIAGSAQNCRISKNLKKWAYCVPSIWRIESYLQMRSNPTVCFQIWVIKFKFCCIDMILEPLPNFKTQFSQKEEVGSYDNTPLNQRYGLVRQISTLALILFPTRKLFLLMKRNNWQADILSNLGPRYFSSGTDSAQVEPGDCRYLTVCCRLHIRSGSRGFFLHHLSSHVLRRR